MNINRKLAFAAALCAASVTAPALAEAPGQMSVQFEDLDLTSAAGQERLERRIDFAAREVCKADQIPAGYRQMHPVTKECVAKAKASAERNLARLVAEKTKRG